MQLQRTPEQFEQVCQANPDAVLELPADGQLIAMATTGSETGARNPPPADPTQQAVEIWSGGDAAPQRLTLGQWLDEDDLFSGLRIDLAEL